MTPELVAGVAAGYGSFVMEEEGRGRRPFCIGRDSRTSGPMFVRAVAAGLLSVGADVVDLGLVPTPTLLLATRNREAAGAVGVTASHNGSEWNALKLAGGDGIFLSPERMERFLASLGEREPRRASWQELGMFREEGGAVDAHIRSILSLPVLDVEAIRRRRFTVALDCVHGAGGTIMPRLLQELGCHVEGIGLETDGLFPRDPEPTAANLAALGERTAETGADLGMAVDPDVDRLALVDGGGIPVGEELTLALAAAAVLGRSPGPVVTNLSSSQLVEDVARHFQVPVHRVPVGEVNVARKMQDIGASVGGEGNGGVIFPALHATRDAPLAAALVLQHLTDEGGDLRSAVDRWPAYRIVKEKVSVPAGGLDGVYEALSSRLEAPDVDRQDGLRLSWPQARRWLHVRPSGTEPVVRLIAEAREEEEARELIGRVRALLAEMDQAPGR